MPQREGAESGKAPHSLRERIREGASQLRDRVRLRLARIAPGVAVLLLTLATPASSSSTAPQPGSAGVPRGNGFEAEPDCTSCHTGFPLNSDGRGILKLDGVPKHYVPGQRYTLTLSLSHPDEERRRWGFQLTAVSAKTLAGAGAFVVTDEPNTQLIRGPVGNREYMSHSYFGTGVGEAGGCSWTFDWVAPQPAVGRIAFYGVGNAANLDGSKEGDRIYTPAPVPKPLAVSAPAKPGAKEASR